MVPIDWLGGAGNNLDQKDGGGTRKSSEVGAPLKIVQLPYYFNPTCTKMINSQFINLIQS